MKRNNWRTAALLTALLAMLTLSACAGVQFRGVAPGSPEASGTPRPERVESTKHWRVALCAYADNALTDRITDGIQSHLEELSAERGPEVGDFEILRANCGGNNALTLPTLEAFFNTGAAPDLIIGITTPVALAMTDLPENGTRLLFAAVSDPEGAGLVDSLSAPGGRLTGSSDFFDTSGVLNLLFALCPDAAKVGLLYSPGEDSAAASVSAAKRFLKERGVEIVERSAVSAEEAPRAAKALVSAGADAVFTPADNTILAAEPEIQNIFADAGIPHFTGGEAFALEGALIGYGADYARLARETAEMAAQILFDGADPASLPVRTCEDGIVTVNPDTCERLGLEYSAVEAALLPYCTRVVRVGG